MKRWLTTLAVLGGWAVLGAGGASAQPGYQPPQVNPNPNVNPYLNLIPNNPYVQYFGLGQGQANNARALQQLQMQVMNQQTGYYPLGMGAAGVGQPVMITTGHPVSFQNMSHYYPMPGQPYAGMGGAGLGGQMPNINTPLPQGYAQGGYYR